MIEEGKVVEIKENRIKVRLERKGECKECSLTDFCELAGEVEKYIEVERGSSSIKVGDKVKLEIENVSILKGTIFLFLIPTFSFLVGVLIGQKLFKNIAFSLGVGVLLLFATFFLVHLFDKKLAPEKIRAKIIEKIPG